MALTQSQFDALKRQLEKKKASIGEEKYSSFIQRAAIDTTVEEPLQADTPLLQKVGTGAAKELGSTGIGIGSIGRGIQKGLSKGVDKLFGTEDFGLGGESVFDKASEKQKKAQEFLTPEGGAEKLGAGLTEAATFFIPGSQVTKATKGANFLTRTASLVGSDVGVTAAQQGGFDKQSTDAGIIAAAFPVAGKTGQIAKGLMPSGAEAGGRVINSLIKPLLKDFSYGKNPGKAVAEAGITASSLDDLGVQIGKARQGVGQDISTLVSKDTSRFDASDSLSALGEALEAANKAPKTNSAIISRIEDLRSDILKFGEDGLPTRNLKDISADEMWELKKEIGELTRWTGNATDDEIVNKALKKVYGNIKGQLDDSIEGMSVLSDKYANLKSAEIATQYRDKISARQGLSSFTAKGAGVAAGLATAAATGGISTGLIVGAGAAGLTEAAGSPTVKTKLAAWLANSSKEELKSAFNEAPWLRSTLQSILLDVDETEEDK